MVRLLAATILIRVIVFTGYTLLRSVYALFQHSNVDLQVFEKFAAGEWDLRILSGFLAADQLLGEPTRVPCCDYPPTHAPV